MFALLISLSNLYLAQKAWIRINQLGYQLGSYKSAVFVSKGGSSITSFDLCDALTGKAVASFKNVKPYGAWGAFDATYRLNCSEFSKPGAYFFKTGEIKSPVFAISNDV